MMLKLQSGSMLTGFGRVPGAAHQALNGLAHPPLSSDTRKAASAAAPIATAVVSSMKRIFAPESFAIAAKSCGVDDGASGATAMPARSAPRKAATYSIELDAQIEITSHGCSPSACSDAATRSIRSLKPA